MLSWTIASWERNGTTPPTRYMPAIVRFLGYVPYTVPRNFAEWLRLSRISLGMTQEELAIRVGVDETTVRKWEIRKHQPTEVSVEKVEMLLKWDLRSERTI
ncbi:MAG: helix-turn-helix domain-containing protein, partial [Acidobacteriota bacterium]